MSRAFDPIYIECFDKWAALANITSWDVWATSLLKRPKCDISPKIIGDLYELHGLLTAMEYRWPNEYPQIQAAFENFRLILEDILKWFFENFRRSESDGVYELEKVEFQIIKPGDTMDDEIRIINHNGVGGHLEDDAVALTKAANHIIDLFQPLYVRLNHKLPAKLSVNYLGGPIGPAGVLIPELSDHEREHIYSYWLMADREMEIFQGTNKFLQPDYLPLKHRTQPLLHSTLTQLQTP